MDMLLNFIWKELFEENIDFKSREFSSEFVQKCQCRVRDRLKDLQSADKDRVHLYNSLKSCNASLRLRTKALDDCRALLIDAQTRIDELDEFRKASDRAIAARLLKTLPEKRVSRLDELDVMDLLGLVEQHMEELKDQASSVTENALILNKNAERDALIEEREAAYAEIRVLRARLSALNNVRSRTKSSVMMDGEGLSGVSTLPDR
jgi:hypothetical protein